MWYLMGAACVFALSVMGCSETSGGSGGTGGAQKGACTSPDDLAIVCAPDFVDGAFGCGSRTIGRCESSDAECISTISSECLQEQHDMSADCGDCFGEATACVLANCQDCVGGVNSQECLVCRAEHCNDDLYDCSGDIVSGCDGDVWCQHVECDDYVDCTQNVCDPADGVCSYPAVADGTSCAGGRCRSGACSLTDTVLPCTEQGIRNAVAAGDGPYTFDCDGETRIATGTEIVIDKDVRLEGGGQMIIDGGLNHRVFSVSRGATVELSGFVITGGRATDVPRGAGIANYGTLKLTDCAVEDNGPEEGDEYMDPVPPEVRGAGVFNDGTLTLVNTRVAHNTGLIGGGIWNQEDLAVIESQIFLNVAIGDGGGLYNARAGTVTLTKSLVEANRGAEGGGIVNDGTVMVAESQVFANAAGGRGGGILNLGTVVLAEAELSGNGAGETGGGIENAESGTLTLRDVTVSSNHADLAGGIFNSGNMILMKSTVSWNGALVLGGIWNSFGGTLAATNSTVSSNEARFLVSDLYNDGTLALTNTTVSKREDVLPTAILNTGFLTMTHSLLDADCEGAIISNGNNIESPGDTCGFEQETDMVNVGDEDLALGPLEDNGGPTMTHALGEGSVAIDVIPEDACEVDEDQRGESRPAGSGCDVGAFEVKP